MQNPNITSPAALVFISYWLQQLLNDAKGLIGYSRTIQPSNLLATLQL